MDQAQSVRPCSNVLCQYGRKVPHLRISSCSSLKTTGGAWTMAQCSEESRYVSALFFRATIRTNDLKAKAVVHQIGQKPSYPDIASLKFETMCPQFISQSNVAHRMMDVLVAGLFVTLVFSTRRANVSIEIPKVAAVAPSSYVPGGRIMASTPQVSDSDPSALAAMEELLTCAICYRIMHNPVSLLTSATNRNAGCCKLSSTLL